MDDERGRKYVAITDAGDDRTGLVVYRREAQVSGPRQICRVPLFGAERSAVEISPIGWGRSIVVKNDSGYRSAFHGTSEAAIAGGIVRIDIREDDSGCDVVWTAPERVPAVVGKLSTNGLLYFYTFEQQPDGENAWYFLALDFVTGKPVYKQFIGAGQPFDINWGSPAIARDGTVYLGIFKGIIAIADAHPAPAGLTPWRSRPISRSPTRSRCTRILRANGGFDARYTARVIILFLVSVVMLPFNWLERLLYGRRIAEQRLSDSPLIILGHDRSGTTHLLNLLSLDPQFAYTRPSQMVLPGLLHPLRQGDRLVAGSDRLPPPVRQHGGRTRQPAGRRSADGEAHAALRVPQVQLPAEPPVLARHLRVQLHRGVASVRGMEAHLSGHAAQSGGADGAQRRCSRARRPWPISNVVLELFPERQVHPHQAQPLQSDPVADPSAQDHGAQVRPGDRHRRAARRLRALPVPGLHGGIPARPSPDSARQPDRDPLRGLRRRPDALAAHHLRNTGPGRLRRDGRPLAGLHQHVSRATSPTGLPTIRP